MEKQEFNDLIEEYGKEIGGYLNTLTNTIKKKNGDDTRIHVQAIIHVLGGCLTELLRTVNNDELSIEVISDLHNKTYEGRDEDHVTLLGFTILLKSKPEKLEIAYENMKKVMRETIEKSKSYDKK